MHTLVWAAVLASMLPQRPAPRAPAAPRTFFTSPVPADRMKGKQAVIQTTAGPIVLDLLPEAAPNHVAYFIKLANDRAFDGTLFHRAIKHGIIQGGDPITRDPSKRELYGTGGLKTLKAEPNAETQTRGAVSAVLVPGDRDSAGSQFFMNITDQPNIQGQYDVFARVVDGIEVAQAISESPVDAKGLVIDRIAITSVTIRDRPVDPFANAAPSELAAHRATLETTAGNIVVEFMADKAPEHVRQFLRLASAGVFDTTAFHRVAKGFVLQTGALSNRRERITEAQQRLVHNLQPEFTDTRHVKGIVSMARGDDPASATTSFFIVLADAPALDGKYTVFGRVVEGLDVMDRIEAAPVNGEAPIDRIELKKVLVTKVQR
jgi:cyclophilin family peptidyl-prolyl cis-trans isomerase